MTISSELSKVVYEGNDATRVFPFPFKIEEAEHLEVITADLDDVQTDLTLGVEFTVSGVGSESGGDVTYPKNPGDDPLPAGHKLSIRRVIPFTQLTDLTNRGPLFAEDLETSLDRVTEGLQQLKEELDRTPKVTITSEQTGNAFIENINSAVATAVNASDAAIVARDEAVDAASAAEASAIDAAQSSAKQFDTTYLGADIYEIPADSLPRNDDSLFVMVDGVIQKKSARTFIAPNKFEIAVNDGQVVTGFSLVGGLSGGGDGGLSTLGSPSLPIAVDPAAGVVIGSGQRQLHFLESETGEQSITANPQIAAGSTLGQELILRGVSDIDYIVLENGTGLSLNGTCNLDSNQSLYLIWDGSVWAEISRRK